MSGHEFRIGNIHRAGEEIPETGEGHALALAEIEAPKVEYPALGLHGSGLRRRAADEARHEEKENYHRPQDDRIRSAHASFFLTTNLARKYVKSGGILAAIVSPAKI
jgi:hypothetical protein